MTILRGFLLQSKYDSLHTNNYITFFLKISTMTMLFQRRSREITEFLSDISSSVFAGESDLKLVSDEGQPVVTSWLLLSLHSPLMRSLLEASEGQVTVYVPVASETLASLVSLLTCGEVRVDGESVFYEEDEVSEAATILGIDLEMLKVECCYNQENEDVESVKKINFLSLLQQPSPIENICDIKEVNHFEIKNVERPRNYSRKYSGAELWLLENYPELFYLWRQSCDNEKDIVNTDCKLRFLFPSAMLRNE